MNSAGYASARLEAGRIEEAGRLAIVNYVPKGHQEANTKLTYLAAYLIATRGTLTPKEMNLILEAGRNRTGVSTS